MEWLKKKCASAPPVMLDDLETVGEYRERWTSVRVIYFTMFLMSLGFSIILTGVWPYLDKLDPTAGKEFMGFVVAANPLGQMLFSPLVGWWANKSGSIRLPLLCTIAMFMVASGIYSSLEHFTSYRKYWMLSSRFLVGVSSGDLSKKIHSMANIAAARSYLSDATRFSERTRAVSMVSLAQVLGFVFGPALQAAVTPLGDAGTYLNMYTASGWINVGMSFFNFVLFLPFVFKEHKIAAREAMVCQGKLSEKEAWKSIKPDYLSSWTMIFAFFVLVFNFVLLETLATSITMDQFAWSKTQSLKYMGILMSVGAVVACLVFAAIRPLTRLIEERKLLLWGGFLITAFGSVLCIPWGPDPPKMAEHIHNLTEFTPNESDLTNSTEELLGCPVSQEWCRHTPRLTVAQFMLAYACVSVGYPLGVTLIQTIFSKLLGPRPQGVWMGLLTGSGCLSRVLGPVFVGLVYSRLGTVWTFCTTSALMGVSMVWIWCVSDRLVPPDFTVHNAPGQHDREMERLTNKEDC